MAMQGGPEGELNFGSQEQPAEAAVPLRWGQKNQGDIWVWTADVVKYRTPTPDDNRVMVFERVEVASIAGVVGQPIRRELKPEEMLRQS